jgi:outer membrane protein OmpA-like peptidoglycan-associated protein
MDHIKKAVAVALILNLTGCAGMSSDTNPPSGNFVGTAIGAGAAAGTFAVLGAKPPLIGVAAIAGAGLGYYMTTLRFASGGVVAAGGHAYTMGDTVVIEVPTDRLFDANTSEFLPGTDPILASIASILGRYSDHDIFISGNTSGSWTHRFEQRMSECRANAVASSLWAQGITNTGSNYKEPDADLEVDTPGRRLIYVGYGDEFPIANNIRLNGIRANSRIQIVATLPYKELHWNQFKRHFKRFKNIGDVSTDPTPPSQDFSRYAYAFSDDHTPASTVTTLEPTSNPRVGGAMPPTEDMQNIQEVKGEKMDISAYNTIVGTSDVREPTPYNNVAREPQTESGVNVVKHRGYKDEDLKDEGASAGRSPK